MNMMTSYSKRKNYIELMWILVFSNNSFTVRFKLGRSRVGSGRVCPASKRAASTSWTAVLKQVCDTNRYTTHVCAGNLTERCFLMSVSSALSPFVASDRMSLVSLILFVLSNICCVLMFHCVHFQLFQESCFSHCWWKRNASCDSAS